MTTFKQQIASFLLGAALVSTIGSSIARAQDAQTEAYPNRDKIGLNLTHVRDYSTEMPFADVFKTSREWIPQRIGAAWGKGPQPELRPDGYPAQLAQGAYLETPLLTVGDEVPTPQGEYTLLYDGQGEIELDKAGEIVSAEPGKIVFQTRADSAQFFVRLKQTDPDRSDPQHPHLLAGPKRSQIALQPAVRCVSAPLWRFAFHGLGRHQR